MRRFVLAVAAGAFFALPLPASAAPIATDISSQGVAIEAPGVGVRVGHDRYESRRREGGRVIVRERRERLSGGECRELRRACLNKERLGEQGEGNCRRYRANCR